MAKGGDLLGRSGSGGFGHKPVPKNVIQPPEKLEEGEDHSVTKQKPVKGSKPTKGGAGPAGGGGAPTSVRPKV
jgi:hypothetical protein